MYLEEKKELVEYGKKMSSEGLSSGTSGNLSIYLKEEGVVLITPSGIGYFDTTPEDIVAMDLEGNIIEGTRKPSSEWHLHTLFYKNKPEARAVVHTHSKFCTTLSTLRMPIKAVHYVIADAGTNEVPCAPYRRYGTEELAKVAVESAKESNAVLLANHGIVVCGKNLKSAYGLAKGMEYVAEIQVTAMSVGEPVVLSKEEMDEVLEGFKTYGQVKREL
ncbi:putative L-ribulose-5-phosphate 4-epimerase [Peptoniphilus duerdenii ATCC BAA-1640]|uniref:Putative L-ribulose-5-phosphate 4-epimerase n=1 Tax=Peptoniphilus duerdenii ATCC BAA-1640 TaxID=862517 RepID=E0NKW1_9FIRM|nr:L-fuculose-phosphate aldolase [Peptoniphilus duerdenii]EFM25587.1 putative L-ribulose-5-phosphate 4-epimerase [Peptoniphilus duerdenii ATCC BAA-1640]